MSIFNIVFYITAAFYVYVIGKLLDAFLGKKKFKITTTLGIYAAFYIATLVAFFVFGNPIINMATSLVFIMLMTLNYKANWKHKIFFSILTYIIMFASEELAYIIYTKLDVQTDIAEPQIIGIFAVMVISRVFVYVISLILSNRKRKTEDGTLPLFSWVVIVTIPVLTTYLTGTIIIHYEIYDSVVLILSIVALVVTNVVTFNLYDLLQKFFSSHFNKVIMENQMDSYKKQLDLIYTSQENSKALLHDMKNHMTVISEFLSQEDIESATGYLKDINKEISANSSKIITGNVEIDSILNYKVSQADKNGININIKSNIPKKLNIATFDLNIVLGNLLDNAIEATINGKSNRDIDISIKLEKGIVYIKTQNYTDKKPKMRNGVVVTSKKDKEHHGYGLKNVRNTVKKYDGDISLSYDDNVFESVVLLYN